MDVEVFEGTLLRLGSEYRALYASREELLREADPIRLLAASPIACSAEVPMRWHNNLQPPKFEVVAQPRNDTDEMTALQCREGSRDTEQSFGPDGENSLWRSHSPDATSIRETSLSQQDVLCKKTTNLSDDVLLKKVTDCSADILANHRRMSTARRSMRSVNESAGVPNGRASAMTPTRSSQGVFSHATSTSEGVYHTGSNRRTRSKYANNEITIDPQTDFEVWDIWSVHYKPHRGTVSGTISPIDGGTALTRRRSRFLQANTLRVGDTLRDDCLCNLLVSRPSSQLRFSWDLFSIFFMGYDVFLIPLAVFDLKETAFLNGMRIAITLFWTADMLFSFFVGFHYGGIVDMRFHSIAAKYLKSWFAFDLIVVITDWSSLLVTSDTDSVGVARASKSLRIARVLRVFRLFRLPKVLKVIQSLSRFIRSENVAIGIGMTKFVLFILVINHYIACGWYAVGEHHPYHSEYTWVKQLLVDSGRAEGEMTTMYQYTTSLHWSFTQFTTASMEVVPENSLERIYSITIVFLALIVFSSFVSGITALVTSFRQKNAERLQQNERVNSYLSSKGLSLELGNRIINFLREWNYDGKDNAIVEQDVIAFRRLPEHLLLDMHAEVFLPVVSRHPLFHHYLLLDEESTMELCHMAMAEMNIPKGERLFSLGQDAERMFFIVRGLLHYSSFDDSFRDPEVVEKVKHVCEPVLWLFWKHQGSMVTVEPTELVELVATEFHITAASSICFPSCQRYARSFCERVKAIKGDRDECGDAFQFDISHDFDQELEMSQLAFEDQFAEMSISYHTKMPRWKNLSSISIASTASVESVTNIICRCFCRSRRRKRSSNGSYD